MSDPVTVFESFASYMNSHYAFFDLYNVDWGKAVADARSYISPQMSDGELFDVLSVLLRPFKDGHLELTAEIKGKERKFEPGQSSVGDTLDRIAVRDGNDKQKLNNQMMMEYWFSDVRKDILKGEGKITANEMIQSGRQF